MKYVFRFVSLVVVLVGLLTVACSKKDDPTPTTGGLNGTVSPVGSITQVTAKNAGGLTFLAKPDATSGAFRLTDLAQGSYTLSFGTATGYKAVADRTLSIVAGQTTAAGTVQAESDGSIKGGTMSWTVAGHTYTTTNLTGVLDRQTNHTFYLLGRSTTGNQVDELGLSLGTTFSGPGAYGFNTPYNNGSYQQATGGGPNGRLSDQ